ncbi:hypothetical protein T02_14427 [Trichinella nativa]|uniref:Uncharacterized protein n=1 Tax=Trichinella nativa TaxID=6335 RepID=A0A0V1LM26_9BILA|nr:hypothetical protein T06_9461 [Trichinella sp. T6]KRZ60565.1 hypothetical protein T02_14427 [Trichinella nativa]
MGKILANALFGRSLGFYCHHARQGTSSTSSSLMLPFFILHCSSFTTDAFHSLTAQHNTNNHRKLLQITLFFQFYNDKQSCGSE